MKIRNILSVVLVAVAFSSCSSMSKVFNPSKSSGSMDFANGSTAGSVLYKLAQQFTQTGSVDFTKAQNILNVATLANSLVSLKSGMNQSAEDFAGGIIAGSNNLVNSSNVKKVVDGLTKVSELDLSKVTDSMEKGRTQVEDVLKFKDGLEKVLNLFK